MVGPNGAGKSTLLRVLAGELRPTHGDVRLLGKPLNAWKSQEVARQRAVLPQSTTLPFAFRVEEVVLLGRAPHVNGDEQPHDYAITNAALTTVGMAGFTERIYPTLSGGEQQRVQLARVLAQIWEEAPLGCRYLLLDEPTNNLDLAHQHHTLQIARCFAAQGVGVLAILHDLNLAAQYADQVCVMKAGRVLACGDPQTALTPALTAEAFAINVMVLPHPCLACPLIVANALPPV